jgi:hypothetical protein
MARGIIFCVQNLVGASYYALLYGPLAHYHNMSIVCNTVILTLFLI